MSITQKVALVVDALPGIGGAERVLMRAMELFPDAPIYTLYYNRHAFLETPIASRRVYSSYIDHLPGARSQYRRYFPLMPGVIERFDLSDFDLILSFSYAVAHGVKLQAGQKHLSYTYTPMRYAWRSNGQYASTISSHWMIRWLFDQFRRWDTSVAARVDSFAAVSYWIAHWVEQAYQRESAVIYPPVDIERFSPRFNHEDYFITISRLVAHKRVDLIVQAFNRLGLPLLVIGLGPELQRLKRLAEPNIRFLGYLPDSTVADLLASARAFICAGEEDFGIAAVEAQAAGCPIIAYRKGGALETVIEGQTGVFFDEPHYGSLIDAVDCFSQRLKYFHPDIIAASVQRFNKQRFFQEFAGFTGTAIDLPRLYSIPGMSVPIVSLTNPPW